MAKGNGLERLSVTIRADQVVMLESFREERGDLALAATVRRVFDEWKTLTGRAEAPAAEPTVAGSRAD